MWYVIHSVVSKTVSLLLRKGGAGVRLLLFLVNSVARKNFVGKTNAQPIFTTTTTGPMVVQDVARITGVHLVQAHMILLVLGSPMVGQKQAKKRGVVDETLEGHGWSFKDM